MIYKSILAAMLLLPGCSALVANPTSRADTAAGVVIPLVKPLLFVEDGAARIVTIPDPDQGYALNTFSLFSKTHLDLKLNTDGTLQSITLEQDNQKALEDLTKLAETMGIRLRNTTDQTDEREAVPRGENVEVFEFVAIPGGGTTLRKLYPAP